MGGYHFPNDLESNVIKFYLYMKNKIKIAPMMDWTDRIRIPARIQCVTNNLKVRVAPMSHFVSQ